jgi:hypothetical protein
VPRRAAELLGGSSSPSSWFNAGARRNHGDRPAAPLDELRDRQIGHGPTDSPNICSVDEDERLGFSGAWLGRTRPRAAGHRTRGITITKGSNDQSKCQCSASGK